MLYSKLATASRRVEALLVVSLFCLTCPTFADQAKKEVHSQADLPRVSYPFKGAISTLLQADDSTFDSTTSQAIAEIDSLLAEYDIQDNATLIEILTAKLSVQELKRDAAGGLETIAKLRELQSKPDLKLTVGLFDEAILKAQQSVSSTQGDEYQKKVKSNYQEAVNALPWDTVQDVMKSARSMSGLISEPLILGRAERDIQPQIDQSGAIPRDAMYQVLEYRADLRTKLPLKSVRVSVLKSYVAAHDTEKPDIWAARDVTLASSDRPQKVLVGVWDTGVDPTVYPGKTYTYANPGPYPAQGLAFTDDGYPSNSALYPLTPERKKQYPEASDSLEARADLQAGIETPVTDTFKERLAKMSSDDVKSLFEQQSFFGGFAHGTHVAGIALRGNPAAKLVVFRFNDNLSDELHFPPSTDYARRMAANFKLIGEFCAQHKVRVVNLSWGDQPSEFEEWLSRTKANQTPEERKQEALALFAIWKQAIIDAMQAAPGTLFVTAAGNSDSDAGFLEDVPASLELPNLITVGATNQAGDATSFTSYGKTVVVYASGYHVESFIPGGKKVRLSGTSMAAPQVTNLAGKLFAVDPALTPEKAKELILAGATLSDDGKRKLIDEKRTLELVKEKRTTAKTGEETKGTGGS
ncbi:MAG: S8 family serine peptidase [Chthoniobacterales bacterium]